MLNVVWGYTDYRDGQYGRNHPASQINKAVLISDVTRQS